MQIIYICLENRLDRLEGRKGHITSQDMLLAMSEERDDHLRGHMTSSENPWNESPGRIETSFVNEYADMELVKGREQSICCCCGVLRGVGKRRAYIRGQKRKRQSGCKEEYVCLVNCDELEMSVINESNDNSNTGGFEDDFVSNQTA